MTCILNTENITKIISITEDNCHLANIFLTVTPEPNGKLTENLRGTVWVICKAKIAISFRPEIQDGYRRRNLGNL